MKTYRIEELSKGTLRDRVMADFRKLKPGDVVFAVDWAKENGEQPRTVTVSVAACGIGQLLRHPVTRRPCMAMVGRGKA